MRPISLLETFSNAHHSAALAFILIVALMGMYVLVEPTVIRSQVYDQFVTSQTVTAEISFVGTAADVTMSPTIPGLTGGTANGYTQVRVYTNNTTGYTMTMTASGSPAMQGGTQGGSIRDFSTTTTGWMSEPSYNFSSTSANSAGFGYSVFASNTNDVDPSFSHDAASECGAGGSSETEGRCWIGASTTPFTVVNTTSETSASGATTTILLRTVIMSNPAPAIPEDIYYATTTLTATAN